MTNILQLLILFYCHITQVSGVFKWTVVGKATDYGQNVTLFCHVPNCCPEDAGWDRWTPQQRTLFIDVKTGRPNKKYDGRIFKNGYTLIIQNLTKDDLNVSYSCLYGVTLGDRKFLLEENVFTYTSSESNFSDVEIAGTIVGVLVVVIIVVSLVCFRKHMNCSHRVPLPIAKEYSGVPSDDPRNGKGSDPGTVLPVLSDRRRGSAYSELTSNDPEVEAESKPDCVSPAEQKGSAYHNETSNDHKDKPKSETTREIPSENDRKECMKAIQSRNEIRKYVRIQVIGKEGVGKTSLVRRLLNQDLKGVSSTDGIDINRICHIKESDGTWIFDNDETEMEKIGKRILHAVEIQQTGNKPDNDERRLAKHNLVGTNKNETPKDDKMLTVDNTEQHPYNQLTDASERSNINETVKKNDRDPIVISITNIPGTSNNNHDDNQLHVVNTRNSNADKPVTNTNTIYDSDKITKAMVNKMHEITFFVKNKKDTMTDEGLIECGIWDFAGQKEYYATHQTFLTTDAIYLLVADITDDLKKVRYDDQFNCDSSGDYIDFWLDSIHCYCEDIKNSKANEKKPSVIMVCTGIDKLSDEELKMKKKEYQQKFLDTFGCQEKGSHIRGMINFISNIKSPAEVFTNLRVQISDIAKEMSYFAEDLPTKWIQLENTLAILKDLMKREKLGYCEKLENIEKLAKTILIERDELLIFLKFQHKIGNVLFFDDKSDYIILQPNWLVDCFRCLICDNAKKSCTTTELYKLNYRGILSDHLIDKLFSKVPELMFGQHKPHILEIMEKFDIVVKPKSMNEYYIPCMITEVSSLENIKAALEVGNQLCTPWLVLEFNFLPISYYNHILFMYIREKKVCREMSDTGKGRPAIYAGKAVVYLDTTKQCNLVICFSRNAISLQIWNNEDMDDHSYRKIEAELRYKIGDLETKVGHKLQYKKKSKCRTGDYSIRAGRISKGDLNKSVKGKYYCQEHKCLHNKGDIENIWFRHNVESTAESTDKMFPEIKSINSTQEIVAEPNQPKIENTINSTHNISCETVDVQEENTHSPEIAVLPDQPIEINESTTESSENLASEITSVNSPQEIIAEPNQSENEEDLLDARSMTGDAAKYSNTKLLITAQKDVSSDLVQKLPRYSKYESMDTRLNSFESWSSSEKPTREDLARAGFFYSGKGDQVKCFFCAGILCQWVKLDVPIEEHKRFYPACPFIKNIGE